MGYPLPLINWHVATTTTPRNKHPANALAIEVRGIRAEGHHLTSRYRGAHSSVFLRARLRPLRETRVAWPLFAALAKF